MTIFKKKLFLNKYFSPLFHLFMKIWPQSEEVCTFIADKLSKVKRLKHWNYIRARYYCGYIADWFCRNEVCRNICWFDDLERLWGTYVSALNVGRLMIVCLKTWRFIPHVLRHIIISRPTFKAETYKPHSLSRSSNQRKNSLETRKCSEITKNVLPFCLILERNRKNWFSAEVDFVGQWTWFHKI